MKTTGIHHKPNPVAWLTLLLTLIAVPALAEEGMSAESVYYGLNNLYLLVSAALVFWMHAGFACLEAGLTQSKNTVNILAKNVAVVALAGVSYYVIGFNLMYPGEFNGFLGFAGVGLATATEAGYADGAYSLFTDFIFQAVFAATAATIISGAVAERIKFHAFLIAALLFVTFIYPIAGSWKWGGGFLDALGFYDFAGSTLVHSVGGWAALTGAIILGPRRGKYTKDGLKPIVGHSIPLATLGVFILFMGWFGFNGGSVLAMDAESVSRVWVTTFLAGCAGGVTAMVTAWIVLKKPDLTMILNGMLAGLVGITAGSDVIMPWPSLLVGGIAGVLVVFAVVFIDQKLKIDDPVGAISVHLVCGIWGTLAVGLFSVDPEHTFIKQLTGVGAIGAFTLVAGIAIWLLLKATIGLRVDEEEEVNGLDVAEHGLEAWPEFKSAT
ncbi:MAG TPA: ammonium transporter [Deferrisomatales bacterium]|nr:ammonium transporter [Deferrisomatales bacterium]